MQPVSKKLEVEFFQRVETKHGATFVRNPNFITNNVPLPHPEIGGGRRQVESLVADFQFAYETRCSSHVITQFITHCSHDGRIAEPEKERHVNYTPDH